MILLNGIITLKTALRDRMFHTVSVVALLILLVVPAFSLFSMRQVQELAVTLALSAISFVLFVLAVFLGASSIWRDVERRYTASVLSLPYSRRSYVLGKFCGISIFLLFCGLILGLAGAFVIVISSLQYPSDQPVNWLNVSVAIAADLLKYILLTAVALFFSSISTSFFLPMFGTIAVFIAGSGSQEVYEYVTGPGGSKLHPVSVALIKAVYFIIPNFSAFDLKIQAIYGIPLIPKGMFLIVAYGVVYTAILITASVMVFDRRQLP